MSNFSEIISEIMLEDILEREGVEYRVGHGSSGEQLNIKECPFCGGNKWKVYANRDNGFGNCFHGSCGETFGLTKFAKALIGADKQKIGAYMESLARDIGWRPRARRTAETEVVDNDDWKLPDSFPLPMTDGSNLKYLLKRRVDNETSKYFHLRYCMAGWFNYTKPDGNNGGMCFDERVIIPVYDLDGTMVTFQGRDLTGTSDRKYLFPPGLPGTGRFLFNGQNVVGKKELIVCEGAFDVIRTFVNLKDTDKAHLGVVGTFGIHLSHGADGSDQKSRFLDLKKKGLKKVTLFWDGEEKAFQKALKAALMLDGLGLGTWIARPPEGKDPGELSAAETMTSLKTAVRVNRMTALKLRLGSS